MVHVYTSIMSHITHFRRSMQARGCRAETIKLRTYHARRACQELGAPTGWTLEHLETYLANPDWAPATRRSVHASLKSFLRSIPEITGAGPLEDVPAARVPRGTPRPLDDDTIRRALAVADARVSLMIELMAYGGLRRGEVAAVRPADVQGQWLRVVGKGGHARQVPLPPHLAARIARAPGPWLFPGQIDGHLSARRVGELVSACLPAGMTGHQLRHRYATTVYRTSQDIRATQELLGHASLNTTMVYTAVDSDTTAGAAAGAWRLAL